MGRRYICIFNFPQVPAFLADGAGFSRVGYQFLGHLEGRHRPAFVFRSHNLRLPTRPLCEIERVVFLGTHTRTRARASVRPNTNTAKLLRSLSPPQIIFLSYDDEGETWIRGNRCEYKLLMAAWYSLARERVTRVHTRLIINYFSRISGIHHRVAFPQIMYAYVHTLISDCFYNGIKLSLCFAQFSNSISVLSYKVSKRISLAVHRSFPCDKFYFVKLGSFVGGK